MKKTKKPLSQTIIVLLIVLALYIFFYLMSPNFRKYTTFLNIMDFSYYIVLMAIGVTFPLITGGVDLSIGTGLICYSLAGGYLVIHMGWPTWLGLLVTVGFGLLVGIVNGILVALMDLPPFLATLCTCMITRGLGSLCSHNFGISWPVRGAPGSEFRNFFKLTIGKTKYPTGFLWIILIVIIMSFVLKHTRIGRYTIAIGSNKEQGWQQLLTLLRLRRSSREPAQVSNLKPLVAQLWVECPQQAVPEVLLVHCLVCLLSVF